LLGRCSTTWVTLSVFYEFIIFEIESHFMPRQAPEMSPSPTLHHATKLRLSHLSLDYYHNLLTAGFAHITFILHFLHSFQSNRYFIYVHMYIYRYANLIIPIYLKLISVILITKCMLNFIF
jgi:hypothetical protein